MANNTTIEWTNHTLNFWTGCKKVSPGCKYCYMYRDQERYGRKPEEVIKVKDSTINNVLRNAKKGDLIFVCSWSDFFIEDADKWRNEAWEIIKDNPHLTFQILTKRPERIKENLPKDWGEGYQNVWLGVSVESQKQADERIYTLITTEAKVRFLSIEPIIGPIDLSGYLVEASGVLRNPIHWIIIGGESGNENGKYRYRKSELKWFYKIVNECKKNKVPVFVKQLGTYLSKYLDLPDRHGKDISSFPEGLEIREFPRI